MKRLSAVLFLGLVAFPLSCNDDDDDGGGLAPYRDEWRTEAEVPFPYLDSNGAPQITTVRIGGRTYQQNFANRGDVIVDFEEGRTTIKIEMRRFTMAGSRPAAEEDFAALSLWAYNANQTSPRKPGDMDPERRCTGDNAVWQDECAIRVYYDGQTQIARAGADLRVTMPAAYRHALRIITEDADTDPDYINRGTVCVRNLAGSADIELANGIASVIMAEDTQPIPTCDAAQIEHCETYEHEGEPAPWHSDCRCIQESQNRFGSLRVETRDGAAANITIDAPQDLWMAITARNDGENQSQQGTHCKALVELDNYIVEDDPFLWQTRGGTTPPYSEAVGGYGTVGISKDCSPVVYTAKPDDFVGANNGHLQDRDPLRGEVRICSGCIRAQSCDQLIDG